MGNKGGTGGSGEQGAERGRSLERGRGGRSQSQVSRGGNGGGRGGGLEKELETLRQQLAAERKEKEALQRRSSGAHDDDAEMDLDDEDGAAAARDARIQTLSDDLESVRRVCGEDSAAFKSAKAELDRLLRERREQRPLRTQLQNAERRIARQKAKVEKITRQSQDLEVRIKELREEEEKVADELVEAVDVLNDLEKERKAILLREAQGEGGVGQGGGTAAAQQPLDDATAWQHVVAAVGARATQPGVDPSVTQQIGSMLQSILALCQSIGNAQAPAPAGTAGVPAQMLGHTTVGQQQQQPPPTPMPLPTPVQQQPVPTEAANADDAIALLGMPAAPAAPVAEEGATAATEAEGGQAEAAGGAGSGEADPPQPAAPAQAAGDAGPDSDDDAGSTATARDMDIDASLAQVPPESRARVREILLRKRKAAKGPRKLKKAVDDGPKCVGGDAKKPTKE